MTGSAFLFLLVGVVMAGTLVDHPKGEHKGTLIFLHGLGDTGDGWFHELVDIRRENPSIRVVCPTAPVSRVTVNGGMRMTSWHDLSDLGDISSQEFAGIELTTSISTSPPCLLPPLTP